jgi:succinate-acetate transporter protein
MSTVSPVSPRESNVVLLEKRHAWTKAGPVVSHLEDEEISMLEERAAATIGDPQPLGLFAFATATWMLGTVIGGAEPNATFIATVPVLFMFGGIVQFIAGLYAWRRANVLAATFFCAFAAFNATTAMFFLMQRFGWIETTGSPVLMQGYLLESFGFIAFALAVASMRANLGWLVTLSLLCVGYFLAGIPNLAGGGGGWAVVGEIGGWFLVASAAAAAYTGLAYVVNSVWNRTVVPIGGEP